jgi:thiamine biosynthesis lipoprotein
LDEIQRLEAQLSLYSLTSELTQINARAAREPVRVEPQLFRLLEHAQQLSRDTEGAFDITIAPLMRAWGFVRDTGRLPDPARIAEARACTGMNLVELDGRAYTIRFQRPGVVLDLGAIGKGYALERAEQLIRDAGVTRGILHGGTSTVCAIGRDDQDRPWRIAIARPEQELATRGLTRASAHDSASQVLAVVELEDASLSVSAVWGKAFAAEGRIYGHVLDPRTGEPADRAVLAALALPSATETDALSTALLALGPAGLEPIGRIRPEARALVVAPGTPSGHFQVSARGIDVTSV